MIENYIPILILVIITIVLAFVLMTLSRILGPHRPNRNKLNPYESGMDPVGEARSRYSIAFYLVAMEFIIFDLEVVFIYPWAVRFLSFDTGTFFAMIFFIVVLFIGLVYTLKKGTLDWDFTELKSSNEI